MTMTRQIITYADLIPPRANPRTVTDTDALQGLAQSIKTDGLLQNLVVRKKGRKYEIVSGERRYRALTLLVEAGEIGTDYPVPVEVRAKLSEDEALRLATVENIQREPLNPIDEAEAFARLLSEGQAIAEVAAQAGVSEATVKRRLALAALCEDAKAQVRAGELSLSVAEALTLGTHEQQRDIIERMGGDYRHDADDIRAMLLDEKPTAALAVFPLEKYTGTLTKDLFADEDATYFDDVAQFRTLQTEAVEERAKGFAEAGAAFVEVVTGWQFASWQYRDATEGETGGVVIHFAPSGRVDIHEGLARREVRASVAAATSETPAAPKAQPEYTRPLINYMAAHKTLAVQAALLDNPRKAREVAVMQMVRVSSVRLDAHKALTAFAEDENLPLAYRAIEEIAGPFREVLEPRCGLMESFGPKRTGAWDWLLNAPKKEHLLFEAVRELPDADLERLHLLLTVLTFGQSNMDRHDTGESLFNAVARDLEVDMRLWWRPDEAFLSRRRKDQLEDIARESGAAKCLGRLKDYKKADLVKALARYFQAERDWLPEAMQFPAVTADAEPEAEPEEADTDNTETDEADADLSEAA
jgi:ParB family chromosome partitioning protein